MARCCFSCARWLRGPTLAETIANPVAAFSGLDKITGRITKFDVYMNETVLLEYADTADGGPDGAGGGA